MLIEVGYPLVMLNSESKNSAPGNMCLTDEFQSLLQVVLSKGFRNPRGMRVRVWRVRVRVWNV